MLQLQPPAPYKFVRDLLVDTQYREQMGCILVVLLRLGGFCVRAGVLLQIFRLVQLIRFYPLYNLVSSVPWLL